MNNQKEQQERGQSDKADLLKSNPLASEQPPKARSFWKRLSKYIAVVLLVYLTVSYFLVPAILKRYEKRHPALNDIPRITRTGSEIPGDPLNVGLIGTDADVKRIMLAANWHPADPLTLRSCLGIAAATVLRHPYDEAPVSNLYLWGRKQDLAFEQPVGNDPRKRHHVRFWRSERVDERGRPFWAGAVTFDERVGFSHTTGQITHHIAADLDAERDFLFHALKQTGHLAEVAILEGFHEVREGKNGGGDRWRTDGNVTLGYLQ
jgi:hypothetical protein